jgi:hypothetical protein
MRSVSLADLRQIAPCTWEIPRSFRNDMRVSARLYASRKWSTTCLRNALWNNW